MSDEDLQAIFERASELPPEKQAAYVLEACGDDDVLRREVEDLLAADAEAAKETFWQRSALHHQVLGGGGAALAIGETVGQYQLVELIGKGGMGAVYRAERIDAQFEKCVAVKLIYGYFQSADVVAHFRAERQILARLEHPNIARLLDGGAREDGSPYLIMEYIEGVGPYEYCREHGFSTADRLLLFQQVCAAVHFAHQHSVIHRDLKPANILVTAEGTPKLLDFGIAKVLNSDPQAADSTVTAPGMVPLTARYSSPEQVRGEPVTTASDVYSLGVILYELLAGHSPYGDAARPPHQWMTAVCDEQPVKPSHWAPKLKGDLDNIILRALRKLPSGRYASVDQFSADIGRFLEGRPVEARGVAPLYVAAKFIRRNRILVGAGALLLCTLVVGLVEVNLARARATRRFNDVQRLAHSVMFDYADGIDRLPGATPVRAKLVQDSLTYLDSLSKEADTPQLQRDVVDAYARMSRVQGDEDNNNLGETAAALASARKGVAAAQRLLKRDKSPQSLTSAAGAFSAEGSLLYDSGDLPAADRAYQRSVGLRQDFARQVPKDVDNSLAVVTCLGHLGDLHGGVGFESMGKTSEAEMYYAQAKEAVESLRHQFPGNVDVEKSSYDALLAISALEDATGKHQQAIADLSEAVTEIDKVSTALPRDTNVKLTLANAESRIGQTLIDARQPSVALPHVTRSAALLQELSAADPGNAVFRRGVSVVQAEWAAAQRGSGDTHGALQHSRQSVALARSLNDGSKDSAQYRADVGIDERKLSEGLLADGQAAEALQAAERATSILCPSGNGTVSTYSLTNCGRSQLAVGNANLALRKPQSAESALRRAEAIASAQSATDPRNAVLRSDAARSQAALAIAIAQSGNSAGAAEMYQRALRNWSVLRQSQWITAEDSHRADAAAQSLESLSRVAPIVKSH